MDTFVKPATLVDRIIRAIEIEEGRGEHIDFILLNSIHKDKLKKECHFNEVSSSILDGTILTIRGKLVSFSEEVGISLIFTAKRAYPTDG